MVDTFVTVSMYRGADKSLARPTSRCILFDGENISFDASLAIYMYMFIVLILRGQGWRSDQGTTLLLGPSRNRFPVVSLGIFSVATERTICPGVDSAAKHEYQGFLLA